MAGHYNEYTKTNGGHRRKGANFNYTNPEGLVEEKKVLEPRCKYNHKTGR